MIRCDHLVTKANLGIQARANKVALARAGLSLVARNKIQAAAVGQAVIKLNDRIGEANYLPGECLGN